MAIAIGVQLPLQPAASDVRLSALNLQEMLYEGGEKN